MWFPRNLHSPNNISLVISLSHSDKTAPEAVSYLLPSIVRQLAAITGEKGEIISASNTELRYSWQDGLKTPDLLLQTSLNPVQDAHDNIFIRGDRAKSRCSRTSTFAHLFVFVFLDKERFNKLWQIHSDRNFHFYFFSFPWGRDKSSMGSLTA